MAKPCSLLNEIFPVHLVMKKILLFSLPMLLAFALIYLIFLRPKQLYSDHLQIGAVYMKYACGDCSLEMKVLSVNSSQYHFILQEEIFPLSVNDKADELCTYISNANYNTAFNEKDTGLQFTIAGRLHKYKGLYTISGCGPARCFIVDSIQYGNSPWVKF